MTLVCDDRFTYSCNLVFVQHSAKVTVFIPENVTKNGFLADIWKLSDVAFLQYSALACCLQTTVEFLSLCACVPVFV